MIDIVDQKPPRARARGDASQALRGRLAVLRAYHSAARLIQCSKGDLVQQVRPTRCPLLILTTTVCERAGKDSLHIDNEHKPYMYKVPGSWGFSPHPRAWPLFLAWQREQSRKGLMPSDLAFRGAPVITSKVALPSFCVACVSTQSKPPCLRDLLTACTEPKP